MNNNEYPGKSGGGRKEFLVVALNRVYLFSASSKTRHDGALEHIYRHDSMVQYFTNQIGTLIR